MLLVILMNFDLYCCHCRIDFKKENERCTTFMSFRFLSTVILRSSRKKTRALSRTFYVFMRIWSYWYLLYNVKKNSTSSVTIRLMTYTTNRRFKKIIIKRGNWITYTICHVTIRYQNINIMWIKKWLLKIEYDYTHHLVFLFLFSFEKSNEFV